MGHISERGEAFMEFWFRGLKVRHHWQIRHRWEDNIKLDLSEKGIDGVNWIQLAQDRF
jgi:hypothetical protein